MDSYVVNDSICNCNMLHMLSGELVSFCESCNMGYVVENLKHITGWLCNCLTQLDTISELEKGINTIRIMCKGLVSR